MGLSKRVGVGIVNHADTLDRGAADAHPQGSITGLVQDLQNMNARIDSVTGNLSIDGGDFTDISVGPVYDGGNF